MVDAGTALFLFLTRERHFGKLVHELSNLTSADTFKGGTGDLLALSALRVLLYAFSSALAITLGKQRNKGPPPPSKATSRVGSRANLAGGASASDLRDPLLRRSGGGSDGSGGSGSDGYSSDNVVAEVCVDDAPNDVTTFDPSLFAPSEEDQYYNQRAVKRRNLIVELTFLLCIAMQAYVAVKSVAFFYAPEKTLRTVLLFGLSVICINAQSVYLRSWVASCTVRTGVLRRDFHAHELQFHDRVVGHVCDMCGLRLNAGSKGLRFGGFRCKTCDFDCCMRCFCRKDRNTAEGGIRGDKGTKEDQERTPAEYLWRVLGLAKLEWPLLTLAIITTLVTSAAALFVPHFQGAAFDAAISLNSTLFNRQATLLLVSSMGVSLFSAFKRACFSLVGQRLNYKVRRRDDDTTVPAANYSTLHTRCFFFFVFFPPG